MSEITSLEQQVKDKTRYNVYVDGRFYCGIKLEVAVKYHLKVGMQVDKDYLSEIQFETEKSQALDKAFDHLSASIKTERQMRTYLEKKGYVPAVIDYCMERLHYYGYVDDDEYCRQYINSVSGRGKRAIYSDLVKRGADAGAIERALADLGEDPEEIYAVLQKYMRGKVADRQGMNKAYRYLLSKGFSYDGAKEAVEKYGDENSSF